MLESWLRHTVAHTGSIIIAPEDIFPLTWSVLKFHIRSRCVPMVILVSQQWHLNVPTSVSQRMGAVAYVNSPRFSLKLHNGSALRDCSSLWYILESSASCWDITDKPEQCGHEDTAQGRWTHTSPNRFFGKVLPLVPSFTYGGSLENFLIFFSWTDIHGKKQYDSLHCQYFKVIIIKWFIVLFVFELFTTLCSRVWISGLASTACSVGWDVHHRS